MRGVITSKGVKIEADVVKMCTGEAVGEPVKSQPWMWCWTTVL